MNKPILCLDFDGVIHQYISPWTDKQTITDHVTDGFFEWAEQAAQYFELVIYSSRSDDILAIKSMMSWLITERKRWRDNHGLHTIEEPLPFSFAEKKPPAFLTIDDRALTFTGNWADFDPEILRLFKPWNK